MSTVVVAAAAATENNGHHCACGRGSAPNGGRVAVNATGARINIISDEVVVVVTGLAGVRRWHSAHLHTTTTGASRHRSQLVDDGSEEYVWSICATLDR